MRAFWVNEWFVSTLKRGFAVKRLRKHTIERLRSERGASISVVPVLLHVCMVVSSIVLAAATATSGRQAELAAMDKRYYNVMSAQELLWDGFEQASYASEGTDNRIKIERSCVIKRQADGSYALADNPDWQVSLNGTALAGTYSPSTHTLFETLAIDTVFPASANQSLSATRTIDVSGTFDATTDANNPHFVTAPQLHAPYNGVTTTVTNGTYNKDSDLSKNLRTNVVITPSSSGDLTFSLESATPNDRDTYKMQFEAKVQIDEDSDLTHIGDDTYKVTCTTYVSWDPTSLEKGSGA